MSAVTQLHDNVGTGQSLLESILHSRVELETGIVPKTTTRMVLALALTEDCAPQEVCDLHATFLGEVDVDVTGLLLVHSDVAVHCLEASPETCIALLRHLHTAPSLIAAARVVMAVEDCPARSFAPWSFRLLSLPREQVSENSGHAAIASLAFAVGKKLTQCGQVMQQLAKEGGNGASGNIQAALEELQSGGSLTSFLPSADRVAWLARCTKLPSAQQYLDDFDAPVSFRPAAADIWP